MRKSSLSVYLGGEEIYWNELLQLSENLFITSRVKLKSRNLDGGEVRRHLIIERVETLAGEKCPDVELKCHVRLRDCQNDRMCNQ